ncbi:DNA double-strand break repair nuclease NurA [bacterium]|nr:DNA double-strand break repair nuclease NurA [bacterium]
MHNSFAGLPVSLVSELLAKNGRIADDLYETLNEIRDNRDKLRGQLQDGGIIQSDSSGGEKEILTSCCVDGCFSTRNLVLSELVYCAACAVEGLVPPSGEKHWDNPLHTVLYHSERGNTNTRGVLEALMMEMRLDIAAQAPHGIVFVNGSFMSPFTTMLTTIKDALVSKESPTSQEFLNRIKPALASFKTIFDSQEPKKIWAGIPPEAPGKEFAASLQWPDRYDDHILFSLLLKPGEFTTPVKVDTSELSKVTELPIKDEKFSAVIDSIVTAMGELHVLYYRPFGWTPALRFEITKSTAADASRLALLLNGIGFQCGVSGIRTPYPVFRAGDMVKNMEKALPSLRKSVLAHITNTHGGDMGDIFSLLMFTGSNMGDDYE